MPRWRRTLSLAVGEWIRDRAVKRAEREQVKAMNGSGGMLLALAMLVAPPAAFGQAGGNDDALRTPENLVREIYALVTFAAGETPDWERVRSLFLPEAVIVLRTTREGSTVFSVDGFVQDFVDFIERASAIETGFREEVLKLESLVFGDIAHVLTLYAASFPDSPQEPQRGVDSWSLVRREGRWWIAAVVNEIPAPERPIPEVLSE